MNHRRVFAQREPLAKVLFAVFVIKVEDEELFGRGRLVQAAMAATYPGVRPKKNISGSQEKFASRPAREDPAPQLMLT